MKQSVVHTKERTNSNEKHLNSPRIINKMIIECVV